MNAPLPTALREVSLSDKYALDKARAYMTGIEALVRLPILQHQRDMQRGLNTAGFVSGYRGSPLGGVDQAMWQAKHYLDQHNVHFQPGVNEELAATAVWGSQQTQLFEGAKYDGVFGMWYGKGPGVDRSMDVFKHANAFGTSRHGGVLAVAGDDHACKSSTLPHQSEHNFIGASIPVLAPANVQEVLDLGIFGWELSRYSGCWVALKAITENMDSAISADIDPERVEITIPEGVELPLDGVHARWPDKPIEQELRLNKYKIYAAREFARVNQLNRITIDSPIPRFGIISTGKAYLDVLQALEDMGIDRAAAAEIGIRVYKVGMPWPLEPQTTHEFAEGLEEILVVEEKRSILEDQLTSQLYNYPVGSRPRVVGEFDETGADLLPNTGELTPAMVALAIAARIQRFYTNPTLEQRVKWVKDKEQSLASKKASLERVPHFCSGCPHNTSTKVPEGSHALGGIGCHYMATWMPDRETHTFTQMGGEGATWIGQAPFTATKHVFQNLGDGTYFHSGLLAIRAAIAAKVNITYKILYNEAVAMTGGQPIDGQLSIDNLIQQLKGEGVKRIALLSDTPAAHQDRIRAWQGLSVHHRDELDRVQRVLREMTGTTIIIYQQPCAAEKRRKRKRDQLATPNRHVVINEEVCEGCGDCSLQSNCLSVLPKETALGRKRQIDQSACNKDFSCLKGFCPSFVSVIGGELKAGDSTKLKRLERPTLPEPSLPTLDKPWNTVVAGIGGTGVLTITSLIAMAAHLEGKGCATMNQTGLAQKFGAVTSHVRVAAQQEDIKAVRIPAGEADLLIGCDLVVAASHDCLAKGARERTHTVVNTAEQATAAFIHDPDAKFPAQEMLQQIAEEVGQADLHTVDATTIARQLLGDTIGANLFLLGIAWQRGFVAVGHAAIMRAIELNHVAVQFNQDAFELGRQYAHDPKPIASALQTPKTSATDLDDIIADRKSRLQDYQDTRYAARYERLVNQIRQSDMHVDQAFSITEVVAKELFRRMAIKDEYEVARLHSSALFKDQLKDQFSGDYRLRFHLAPPLLSRRDKVTGQVQKREFGGWVLILFQAIAFCRFLRGTPFDIFGMTQERRRERHDLKNYIQHIEQVTTLLTSNNYSRARELLSLSAKLRGYGHVKDGNRDKLQSEEQRLIAQLKSGENIVKILEPSPLYPPPE